jgi:hypothetical protein
MSDRRDLSDWLRAIDALKPRGTAELEAIARMLGFQFRGTEPAATTAQRRTRPSPQPPEMAGTTPNQVVPESKPRRRVESVLIEQNTSRNPAPQWLATAHYLQSVDNSHLRQTMPLEPLFPARTSRAILSDALATASPNGPLHLPRLIELLSQAQVVRDVPRRSIPTLARGVQLLIDRGESMQPFVADQAALRATLVSVAGRDRTEVLYFNGSPLWGAGTGPNDDWPRYHSPTPGTPVVALTDLGIAQPPGVAGLAASSDWLDFAGTLTRAGCPLLALVPYPRPRWPAALSKRMTIIQWDRATTAAVVRRAIAGRLRIAYES